LSTHLARSYHHLFPLRGWVEVSWGEAARSKEKGCFSCLAGFPVVPLGAGVKIKLVNKGGKGTGVGDGGGLAGGGGGGRGKGDGGVTEVKTVGVSESGRYKCQVCGNHFCIDCDVFAHEVIHNCPGCQSDTRGVVEAEGNGGDVVNGQGTVANEAMVIDS
jgi:transcription initiation factor TFIIH subunit 2